MFSLPCFSQDNGEPLLTLSNKIDTVFGTTLVAKLEATAIFENRRTKMYETWMKVDTSLMTVGHRSYFCWDLCYTVEDTVSLDWQPIAPGSVYSGFFCHMEPNNRQGITPLKFTIFDGNNPSDNIDFWVVFVVQNVTTVNEKFLSSRTFSISSTNEFLKAIPTKNIEGQTSYEILLPNGQSVQKANFNGELFVPTSHLASGTYYVIIRNNNLPLDFHPITIVR